jgi:predicted ester cyclase
MFHYVNELHKSRVQQFYELVWNKQCTNALPDYVNKGISFRGTFGQVEHGIDAFVSHVNETHEAFRGFRVTLTEVLSEEGKVFTRFLNCGIHQGYFCGVKPSHKSVSWEGASVLTLEKQIITNISSIADFNNLKSAASMQ